MIKLPSFNEQNVPLIAPEATTTPLGPSIVSGVVVVLVC